MSRPDFLAFELDEDEDHHRASIPEELLEQLSLAEDAARLTLNGLSDIDETLDLTSPRGLVILLLAKSAKGVRFAALGIQLGYYSGSSAVLRSALETVELAALFDSDPSEVAVWLRNELSTPPPEGIEEYRKSQSKAARNALVDKEDNPKALRNGLYQYHTEASKQIHPTLVGIVEEFGVEIKDLIPPALKEIFLTRGEDGNQALELYALLSKRDPDSLPELRNDERERTMFYLFGRYDEPTISDSAVLAFFIGQQLLNLTERMVSKLDSHRKFRKDFREWHKLAGLIPK